MEPSAGTMQLAQAKIPYRIPLVGGFTDLPLFYRKFSGQTVSCTIDKFLMVSIRKNAYGGLDVESKADLAWGTGMGSSGVYYAALISAIAKSKKQRLPKLRIAEMAYELETGIEKNATGRQDAVACLYKGIS